MSFARFGSLMGFFLGNLRQWAWTGRTQKFNNYTIENEHNMENYREACWVLRFSPLLFSCQKDRILLPSSHDMSNCLENLPFRSSSQPEERKTATFV